MDVAPPHDRYLRVSKFDGGMESYTLKSNRQLHYSCSCGVKNPEKIIPAVKAAWGQDPLSRKREKWSKPEKYGVRMTTLGYRRYESVRFYVLQGDISSSMVSLSLDGEGRKFYVFQHTWNLVCNMFLRNQVTERSCKYNIGLISDFVSQIYFFIRLSGLAGLFSFMLREAGGQRRPQEKQLWFHILSDNNAIAIILSNVLWQLR